ncbi:MAG: GDP-mannose 4,6-dehydratase [Pseudanabaenaceae cyanobacterium]
MTATWNGGKQPKPVHQICAQGAVVSATSDHVVFTATGEQRSADIQLGTQLQLIDLPPPPEQIDLTTTEAWLLGLITAEGYITPEGTVQITNQDQELLRRAISHWRKVTGGDYHSNSPTQLYLTGANDYGRYLRNQLYTHYNYKRIPKRVLNADYHARLAFLEGFNGKSTPCTYEFQSFKTDSPVLSAGLYWLALTTLNRRPIICPEKTYYQIHLNSPNPAVLPEVVKNEAIDYQGWLFDLATVSGTFHAGIGQAWIHNSPRRGETFVTRKITRAIANIIYKKQNKLYLGNLDAKRDWGYAKDYVEAMWLMLQQDQPDDYVIATGETHSVREFLEVAFNYVNLRWEDYVEIDPRYFRPTEVELLIGDASKAKVKLGWQPRVTFQELVKIMVDADLAAVGKAP